MRRRGGVQPFLSVVAPERDAPEPVQIPGQTKRAPRGQIPWRTLASDRSRPGSAREHWSAKTGRVELVRSSRTRLCAVKGSLLGPHQLFLEMAVQERAYLRERLSHLRNPIVSPVLRVRLALVDLEKGIDA